MNAAVKNFGICGARPKSYLEAFKRDKYNVSDADIIVIMLGTNGGLELGNEADTENNYYRELVELCKTESPDALIVVCTPPHATENPEYSNCGYEKQAEKSREFVRNFAEKEHLNLIEVANCPEFTAENEKIMQPNDGLHFGEKGYETLAKYIAENLIEIINGG